MIHLWWNLWVFCYCFIIFFNDGSFEHFLQYDRTNNYKTNEHQIEVRYSVTGEDYSHYQNTITEMGQTAGEDYEHQYNNLIMTWILMFWKQGTDGDHLRKQGKRCWAQQKDGDQFLWQWRHVFWGGKSRKHHPWCKHPRLIKTIAANKGEEPSYLGRILVVTSKSLKEDVLIGDILSLFMFQGPRPYSHL